MPRIIIKDVVLRRCPFCGSIRVHQEFLTDLHLSTVECGNCGALISFVGSDDPDSTREKYNRREYEHLNSPDEDVY